jgi:two-component system nitrate/nitrite response regulator NarL
LTVLRALARGETSKEIARDLCCSPLTIDSHVRSILRKLACESRQKAVFLARERGLL